MNYEIFSYVISKRLEKVLAMSIVGISIALATVTFQSITHNRILTPSILGLDALHIMFQLLSVLLLGAFSDWIMNPLISFFVSATLMVVFSMMLYKWIFSRTSSVYFMVLVGIVVGAFLSSFNGMLQIMISPDVFNMVIDRLFANFANVNHDIIYICIVVNLLVIIRLYLKGPIMDVLNLGKDYSINLGVSYEKEVNHLLVLVFMLIGTSTALVGPITFLGFLAVNITRQILKHHQHKYLMIGSCAVAASALFLGQLMVEHVLSFGLPISVLISMVGGFYFIVILLKEVSYD